ncbi:N-acetyltransferase [Archangium gephyra]|uniref:N-acetyltransferase n=1 Tax=Archangium gephyra TaxID=48 RepID=UPI0035D48F56
MNSGAVGQLLRHLPEGGTLWVRGLGRSMWPLLRSGDSLQVLRCAAEAVAPGDLAVLLRADGGLTAHLVTGTSPVRTASLLGREDPSAELLGRVIRVRTRGVEVPVPVLARPLLRAAQRLGTTAFRSPVLRGARHLARAWGTSEWTRRGRARWLGALTVRPLRPGEEEALLVFVGHHLPHAAAELGPGLARGAGLAVVALDARGRLRGFAYAEQGRVRWRVVAPVARGLGVDGALQRELAREARARGWEVRPPPLHQPEE